MAITNATRKLVQGIVKVFFLMCLCACALPLSFLVKWMCLLHSGFKVSVSVAYLFGLLYLTGFFFFAKRKSGSKMLGSLE